MSQRTVFAFLLLFGGLALCAYGAADHDPYYGESPRFYAEVLENCRRCRTAGMFLILLAAIEEGIAAFSRDGRPQCYKCLGRLEGRASVCQHCGTDLGWIRAHGMTWISTTPKAAASSDLEAEVRLQDLREKHKGLRGTAGGIWNGG